MSLLLIPWEVLQFALSWLVDWELVIVRRVSRRFRDSCEKKDVKIPRALAYESIPWLIWARNNDLNPAHHEFTARSYQVVRTGKIEVLRVLLTQTSTPSFYSIMDCAIQGNQIEIIRAMCGGYMGRDRWLVSWFCEQAVRYGRPQVLRELRDGSLGEKCPWSKSQCLELARGFPEMVSLIESGVLD